MERVRAKRKFRYDPSHRDYEARYGLKREKEHPWAAERRRRDQLQVQARKRGKFILFPDTMPAERDFTRAFMAMLYFHKGNDTAQEKLSKLIVTEHKRHPLPDDEDRDDRKGRELA